MSAAQVAAIAELIDTQSATKADVEGAEHRLDLKIDRVEHRLDMKIEALDKKLDTKTTILQGETNIVKWMMGFVLANKVAIFVKLFLR